MKDLLRHLKYCVDYETHSESNPNCNCGDICRCSTISGARITGTDRVIQSIMDGLPKNTSVWLRYAVERLCSIHRLFDRGLYSVDICNGYYGQEVNGVLLEQEVHDQFTADVNELEGIKDKNLLVEELLKKEYGFLLPSLKGAKYSIKKVPILEIQMGSDTHYKRVCKVALSYYKDHPMNIPQAVALKVGKNKYRLIDGYHRIAAAIQQDKVEVSLIVGKHGS